jgi:hypothetical protein
MGPPEVPRSSRSRYATLNTSRIVITTIVMMAVVLLMLLGYLSLITGGDWSRKLNSAEGAVVLAIPIVGLLIGSCLGPFVWGFLGKKFFAFTREEVEPFVRPALPFAVLTRYKDWYLDAVFGPRPAGDAEVRGASERDEWHHLSDDRAASTDVLYEGTASLIREPWNEQTTRQFNLAMLRTDWVQARRGKLRIMPEALSFDDWTLPYAEIDDAVVTLVKGIVPGWMIRIKSQGSPFQFSVTGSFFGGELPFPHRRTTESGFTWSYVLVRLLPLVGMLAFFIWSRKK